MWRRKNVLNCSYSKARSHLVNKSWNRLFMSVNVSSLVLLRLRWGICMTRMLKSLGIVYIGKMKREERVENDSSCQKWHYLFPSAERVEVLNIEGLWLNIQLAEHKAPSGICCKWPYRRRKAGAQLCTCLYGRRNEKMHYQRAFSLKDILWGMSAVNVKTSLEF